MRDALYHLYHIVSGIDARNVGGARHMAGILHCEKLLDVIRKDLEPDSIPECDNGVVFGLPRHLLGR